MNKNKKAAVVALAGVGLFAAMAMTGKKAKAKGKTPLELEEAEDGAIDLDALPQPEPQSPGWPQPEPASLPPGMTAQPTPATSAPTPTHIPTSIPTALPVPPMPTLPGEVPPIPAEIPIPQVTVPPRPPTSTAELPSPVPEDTAIMVQRLLSQEAGPNWKTRDPVVKAWQASRGLLDDGEYGVKSALRTADEIGVVPLVRFWPKGSYPEGSWIRDYQAELVKKAMSAPQPRKSQLMASADREKGQGFARNVKAESKVVTLQPAAATQNFEGPNA